MNGFYLLFILLHSIVKLVVVDDGWMQRIKKVQIGVGYIRIKKKDLIMLWMAIFI